MSGPRGPLPDPNRRRRNAPTIPTTSLPVSGRPGRAPRPPAWLMLGAAGLAWWRWAWATPQACAWGPGHEVAIARRASLEDDLAAVASVESLDLLDVADAEKTAEVRTVVSRLAALATGRLAICKECRELDDRLGLTPKGMAALRWTVVADPQPASAVPAGVVDMTAERRRRVADAS